MSGEPKTPNKPNLGGLGKPAIRLPDAQNAQTPFRGLGFGQGDASPNKDGTEQAERGTGDGSKSRAAPVSKSDEVVERILEAVSDGTPLAEVLREDWAPHHSSFYAWLKDPELNRRFAHARELGHDAIAARTRRVARGEEGSSNDVKRDRLIVDTDLKLLEKWDRRYRPAQVLAGDPEAPLNPLPTDPAVALLEILGEAQKRKEAHERKLVEWREAGGDLKRLLPPPFDGSDLA